MRDARADRRPDQGQAGARVDLSRQQTRHHRHDAGQRIHQVHREVRPGGVPAGTPQRHLYGIRRGGDRPGQQPHLAALQPGVAVQREHPLQTVQPSAGDYCLRPAGNQLLSGLEDEPHPPGQLRRGRQRQGHAECDARVRVVAARVTDTVHCGLVRHILQIPQRQRIDVCPKADRPLPCSDVTDQPGPHRQHLRLQSGGPQLRDQQCGCLVLAEPELGIRVQMPAYGDEVGGVVVHPPVQPTETHAHNLEFETDGGRDCSLVAIRHRFSKGS